MRTHNLRFGLVLIFVSLLCRCEIDTKLNVTGGNPPVFEMTGNGRLSWIRIRGHKTQREVYGEDALIYWQLNNKNDRGTVGRLGSVTYGIVPEGYVQKYPENGAAPKLDEGQHYYINVTTTEANGADGFFMILNGKAYYSKSGSDLPAETPLTP